MKLKPLAVLFLGATASVPASLVMAQSRSSLEEIIVTAQKREETLQDVPIAISAISADSLAKQGIDNLNDFQGGQVPSLKVVQFAGRPNTLFLAIRGIAEQDPTQLTTERSVAVYVDNVYIARGNGMDTEAFDIDRIEVLRGPQGTLFGRSAEGGALNITTRKPTGNFGFKQELEATTLDEYKSRTLIDTPEWNGLSASLGYVYRGANGWIGNPGGKRDYNWQKKNAYRLALQYNAEDVVIDYAYDRSDLDYMQNYNHLLHKPALSQNPRPVDTKRQDRGLGTLEPVQITESDGHNLSLEWAINDELTFRSITGYRDLKDDGPSSGSGANAFIPGPALGLPATVAISDAQSFAVTRQDQQSQEFQLIGDTGRLEWQAGLMYFHEDGSFNGWTAFGDIYSCPTGAIVGGLPVGYGSACVARVLVPTTYTPIRNTFTKADTDSYGVFGQATWNPDILEDRLKITLGLRYSNDQKDIHRTLESGVPVNVRAEADSERVDPALTIAYKLLDDTSVYARYSTAYRGGGVAMREVFTFTPFAEEEIEATEVGVKSVFWDNRARINAAAFYNEIDQWQATIQQTNCGPRPCASSNTRIANADGTARTHGVELDGSLLLTEGLTVSLAYTYLDNSVPKLLDGTVVRQPTLLNAPRNSWALNVDYAFEPFSFGQLAAHVDVTDSDEFCYNALTCKQDAVMVASDLSGVNGGDNNRIINARLTLSDIPLGEQGRLEAALWARNLTDEEYYSFGYVVPGGSSDYSKSTSNNTATSYSDPRSVGVTLIYQY